MRLSVVIPTRERPQLLTDCLRTLAAQIDAPKLEVIVVDDGSEVPLERVVASIAREGLPARWVHQSQAGLNVARNRGIGEAVGDVIAFLDDDTFVGPGWAKALDEGFAQTGAAAIGGRIRLQLAAAVPRWLTPARLSYLSEYDLGSEPREISGPPLPVGANFALTHAAATEHGPFREGLGRVGAGLVSNEETELLSRVLEAGERIVYWPDAEVLHRVPRERMSKAWFRHRAYAQGVSDARTHGNGRPADALALGREVVRAGRAAPILGRRLLEGRGGFDATLWVNYCRGRFDELRLQRAGARMNRGKNN